MKRIRTNTSRLFLLATGFLMLVLSVLPHHHHGQRICFAVTECCLSCQNESKTTGHNHSESDASCDLKQLFVMSSRDDNSNFHPLSHDSGISFADLYIALLFTTENSVPAPDCRESHLSAPPFLETLTAIDVSRISALRAPPVFIA